MSLSVECPPKTTKNLYKKVLNVVSEVWLVLGFLILFLIQRLAWIVLSQDQSKHWRPLQCSVWEEENISDVINHCLTMSDGDIKYFYWVWHALCPAVWSAWSLRITFNVNINHFNHQDADRLSGWTSSAYHYQILEKFSLLTKIEICFDWFLTGFVTIWCIWRLAVNVPNWWVVILHGTRPRWFYLKITTQVVRF